jgi:CheY-like chemotaxis protein
MKPFVALVDDDDDVRDVMGFALENEGIESVAFENGRIALEKLKELDSSEYPCLLIVDYLMPEMDGLTFVQTVHSQFAMSLAKIPMYLSSAIDTFGDDVVIPPGVKVIGKPLDLDDFLDIVKGHLP